MGIWEEREATIREMVERGMTDEQIGAELGGVSGKRIFQVRKKLKIPSNYRPMGNRYQQNIDALNTPEPLVGETYIDPETGLTVTRYPARYAAGALVTGVTARPRR